MVLVATIRALKMHGGVVKDDLKKEILGALEKGFANLERHVENLQKYGVPVVVSINRFSSDTEGEIALLKKLSAKLGVECVMADHWAEGGAGAVEVAKTVVRTVELQKGQFKPLYPDDMRCGEKTRTIAREIYRANDITVDNAAKRPIRRAGEGKAWPVADLRRQDPIQLLHQCRRHAGSPTGHIAPVRDVRLRPGRGSWWWCGAISSTMPGLPKGAGSELDRARQGRPHHRPILRAKGVARLTG